MKAGDEVNVFDPDPIAWGGRDVGDNSQFWKLATILATYYVDGGRKVADVRFHHDQRISRAHFTDGIKPCD